MLRRDKIQDYENKLTNIEKEMEKVERIMQIGKLDNAPISHLIKPNGSTTLLLIDCQCTHREALRNP